MENKHYVPSIEEFHVGFEYEYRQDQYNKYEEVACDLVCDDLNILREDIKKDLIRVKYLDEEDIESLGFTYYKKGYGDNSSLYRHNKGIALHITGDTIKFITTTNVNANIKFEGNIKNKSELKKLLTMLGI